MVDASGIGGASATADWSRAPAKLRRGSVLRWVLSHREPWMSNEMLRPWKWCGKNLENDDSVLDLGVFILFSNICLIHVTCAVYKLLLIYPISQNHLTP